MVLCIIALLVAVVLPSIGLAKEKGRLGSCIGNQRLIAGAVHLYHEDYGSFPLNYAHNYGPWTGTYQRWALALLSPYVGGPPGPYLRGLQVGEFAEAYICPSADPAVWVYNPMDQYHACYWTNITVRANRGFYGPYGGLFNTAGNDGMPPGWDIDSGGMARFYGRVCPNYDWAHWRSVYNPTFDSVRNPNGMVFSGDTNNDFMTEVEDEEGNRYPLWHPTYPGEWCIRPGWAWVHGSLGFDRHGRKIVLNYLDGHARAFPQDELEKYSFWPGPHAAQEATGDFMLNYVGDDGCGGTRIHYIPDNVARWE
ncbi:MAG: hypothetical protein AMJ81_00305 [Phycisphaerae bacterium SM23_33]|nr:MAG: hypothetical protein AMJ81_00305 [Phycisphaerae bacterium SM23_33]